MTGETRAELEKSGDLRGSELAPDREKHDQVEEALRQFRTLRDRRLQRAFDALPLAIVIATTVLVFARWYSRGAPSLAYMSGALAVVISLLITRGLFLRFPQTLLVIWRRKLLCPRTTGKVASSPMAVKEIDAQFLRFIHESERQLNSKLGLAFALIGLVFVLWLLSLVDPGRTSSILADFRNDPAATSIAAIIRVTYLAGGLVGGLIGWRVVGIARRIKALGTDFDIDLQVEHPDSCGGLRPVGDLCLMIAYILSPFLLLVGGWLTFMNVVDVAYLGIPSARLQSAVTTLQALIIPLVLLSLVGFIHPLASIHTAMDRARARFHVRLDLISQEIHQISRDLLTNAEDLSAEQGTSLEKKLDFLRRVYDRNSRIPTWPVGFGHVWRLATTQVVPAIGLSASGVGFVRNLLGLFR